MQVSLKRKNTVGAIVYDGANSAYTKGEMFCILRDGEVHKFPVCTLEYVIMPGEVVEPESAIKVEVHLDHMSLPVAFPSAANTFLEGPFYCIQETGVGEIIKYPLADIFRVIETKEPSRSLGKQ